MAKLDTSHLVLKPVMVNGKMQHRWVNKETNQEHAPHGSKITFEHHGKQMTGTVGSVVKTGEYAVKGDNGITYNKHKHQFNVNQTSTKEPQTTNDVALDESHKAAKKLGVEITIDGFGDSYLVNLKPKGKYDINEYGCHMNISWDDDKDGKLDVQVNVDREEKEDDEPDYEDEDGFDPGYEGGIDRVEFEAYRGNSVLEGIKIMKQGLNIKPKRGVEVERTHIEHRKINEKPNISVDKLVDNKINSEKDLTKILDDIGKDKIFQKWALLRFGGYGDEEGDLTPKDLINGWCDSVAAYIKLHHPNDKELKIIDSPNWGTGHVFIEYKGKYYDGFNSSGVKDPTQLEFFKPYKKKDQEQRKLTAEEIEHIKDKLTDSTNEWVRSEDFHHKGYDIEDEDRASLEKIRARELDKMKKSGVKYFGLSIDSYKKELSKIKK